MQFNTCYRRMSMPTGGGVLKIGSRLCYTLPWLPDSLDVQKTDKRRDIHVSCGIYGIWNGVQGSGMTASPSGGLDRGYGTRATVLRQHIGYTCLTGQLGE
ncbi:hypothetical protein CROQUDRAFT_684280 [Cronartium quercuum f. sp. fusiforme G11]|uniref:Uncharacterized protein n=1 Tax=Cronartium quercuum f. sp. fusiforme G11 TaxID=708437 RepID=A0A9P6T7C5_9BASI|nr:hypothetical protein CROQUDRAFT_684280 [Cronartium quercuum f. sp. fusiforme G11]